jgi:hypothetical protein
MRTFAGLLILIALETATGPGILPAAELQPAAYSAWQAYLQTAGMRMQARLGATGRFLWIDEAPGRDVRVQNGVILYPSGKPRCRRRRLASEPRRVPVSSYRNGPRRLPLIRQ